MGKATELIAKMQVLLFSAVDGKLQAQHFLPLKKSCFHMSSVQSGRKKDHTVYGYCECLDGNAVNWSLTQNRDG